MSTAATKVVIIGGGIAGLSAAWYCQQQGINYTLIEASYRWGGKIYTEHVMLSGYEQPLVIETSPDGFITRKPWAMDLIHQLGLDDQIIPVNKLPERIYILTGGELVPMPEGLRLLVPTEFAPFLASSLFTPEGKLHVLADMYMPSKTDDEDESLAEFITRRLGAEAVDKLGEPLLAGVYNAEADKQSILATFPNYRKIEAEYGSLIRGMRLMKNQQKPSNQPSLVSLKNGMGQLIDALVEQLTGDLILEKSIGKGMMHHASTGYIIDLGNGDTISAQHIILTTPADITANLLNNLAPESAQELAQLRQEGVGSISLAYKKADISHPMDAYGVVIPSSEKRRIDGITWTSNKWDYRAPEDVALMRAFFGGPHTRDMLSKSDDEILSIVRDELRDIMGITAEPIYYRINRLPKGYPQYDVGHLDRIAAIESNLPEGIYVTGSPYRGLGLPDVIHQSQQLIAKITEKIRG